MSELTNSSAEPTAADAGATARRWVAAWRAAGPALEEVRRRELRAIDGHKAIALLTATADYHAEPRKSRCSSGLVEQQRWFKKARSRA